MAKFTPDKIIVIFTVVSAAMLQLIDTSIVNVALTDMMGNLGATFEEIGWVITGYAVSNVIMITLSGWMSAKFGRKYYFAGSIILFTVASVFCGLSHNVWELVIFRIIQGLGGGGLLATAQAILVETFPKEELGLANAIYGMGVIIGPAIGPTLGGYITDNMAWQWIFFINVPFGILATFLTLTFVKEPDDKMTAGKMDWFAFGLLVAAIGALQVVLEKGQSEDWFQTRYITALTVTAVITSVLFVWWEMRVKDPIVNLRLFSIRSFTMGTLFNFVLGFGLYGTTLLVPIFCQNLLGLTALQTGLLMLPGSLATAFMMPVVGLMMKRNWVHPAAYAGVGLFLFFLFSLDMSQLNTSAGGHDFLWPLIVRGFAMGLIFIPLTTISLADLAGKEIPQGTALSNMVRQMGGSIGIALITAFVSIGSARHYSDLTENITDTSPIAQQRINALKNFFMSKGYDAQSALHNSYQTISGEISRQAIMLTYRDIFFDLGVFFLISIPFLLLFREKQPGLKKAAPTTIEWGME